MDAKKLTKFKKILQDRKEKILTDQKLSLFQESLTLKSEEFVDEGDAATQGVMRDLDCRLMDREYEELHKIDAALERIAIGEYGVCPDCGEDIAEKRLEVQPFAVFCIQHAEQKEAKGRFNKAS